MRRRLVVVGAGVSGLAAAYTAVRAAHEIAAELEVIVLERADHVGGRASTLRRDGWLMELGPSGYLDNVPEMAGLVREIGLEQERVEARRAAARRFIFRRGRLHELGANPLKPLASGLLGLAALLRALGEPLARRRGDESDESIHDFARRRFGRRVAERIVDTAMLGIFAGDARRLSVGACFPELTELEREYGSVVRGMLGRRRQRRRAQRRRPNLDAETGATETAPPSGRLCSFPAGMQRLSEALAASLGATPAVELRLGTGVERIRVAGIGANGVAGADGEPVGEGRTDLGRAGFLLDLSDGNRLRADAIVLATPAPAAARLLEGAAQAAARELAAIAAPPVAVVGLGFPPDAAAHFPTGFGVLVARGEAPRMLGCLLESHIYPGRGPEGHTLARVMLGGAVDPSVTELDDDELASQALDDLRLVFGVRAQPVFRHVVRWPQAIPQYEIGHGDIRKRVEAALDAVPGLYLAGDALAGVSYPKTAASGIRQAKRALTYLGGSEPRLRGERGRSPSGPL